MRTAVGWPCGVTARQPGGDSGCARFCRGRGPPQALAVRAAPRGWNFLASPSHPTLEGVLLIPASARAAARKTAAPPCAFIAAMPAAWDELRLRVLFVVTRMTDSFRNNYVGVPTPFKHWSFSKFSTQRHTEQATSG